MEARVERNGRRRFTAAWSILIVAGMMAAVSMVAPAAGAPRGEGWTATWIGRDTPRPWPHYGEQNPAPLLRKEFDASKGVQSATLTIAAAGYYVAWINGRRVGDQVLDPSPSEYHKTVFSRSFDVTGHLRRGENAIGVTLGRGYFATPMGAGDPFGLASQPWVQEPRLLAQLDITYKDGTRARIGTDGTWTIADGPARDALWYGETYDARDEQPGWTRAGFDDGAWPDAPEQPSPTEAVVPATEPPVRVVDTWNPANVTKPKPGVEVYDFGRATAGWARISVKGAPGTKVTLLFGEQLLSDGTVTPAAYGDTSITHLDSYTLKGGGAETWEPSFTRHGFRYVQVTYTPSKPTSFSIQARRVHSDVASTGGFVSSNSLLNTIVRNQRTTILDNLIGIPLDNTIRDRQGFTADADKTLPGALLTLDTEALFRQWLRTLRDTQAADGSLPVTAPTTGPWRDDPSWSGTLIYLGWNLYRHSGSVSDLEDNYAAMARWMRHMDTKVASTGNLFAEFAFGDWSPPGAELGGANLAPPESGTLVATADLYNEARTLAEIARILGHDGDAVSFDALAGRVAIAFNDAFFDERANVYSNPQRHPWAAGHWTPVDVSGYRQTSNIVPLVYGLVPEGHEDAVFANLVDDVVDRGYHLDTGITGTKLILPLLTERGRGDVAYRLATQTTYPSWGYMIQGQGATTMFETWRSVSTSAALSQPMLGTVVDWLYGYLAGIRPAAPGYSTILIDPLVPEDLRTASASIVTPHGEASSRWIRTRDRLTLTIEIPAGVEAEVHLPVTAGAEVRQTRGHGVRQRPDAAGDVVYTVGEGRSVFVVTR